MPTLVLKLLLTPALIAVASLAGRRWGPAISGWLVGIPFTSGPIALFLALAHGDAFAADAATGTLAGTLSQAAFCLAYTWLAVGVGWGWPAALLAGALAFFAATAALKPLTLPLAALVVTAIAALLLALRLMPAATADTSKTATSVSPPRWDLPLRMLVATAFVLLLTAVAPQLGPRLTGLLAPFPLYAAVLAVFAHQQHGPLPAARVLRGLLLGLCAFVAFFLTLAVALVPLGTGRAFAVAIVLALAVQGVSLWALQRRGRSHSQ
jgi:hypothetical protein